MSDPFQIVLDMARKLSLNERIGLADILYAEAAMPMEEWEAAWAKECESRLAALDRGEMQLIDADEVHAALDAKFGPPRRRIVSGTPSRQRRLCGIC